MDTKSSKKDEINIIEEQIYNEKSNIRHIENAYLNIKRINLNLNKCIDLLNRSIIGPKTTKIIRGLSDKQNSIYLSTSSNLEDKKMNIESSIIKLHKQKEGIVDELKKSTDDENNNK